MAAPNASPVWLFFAKDKDDPSLVRCKKCQREFKKPSTSTLRYHAESGHLLRVPKLPAKRGVHQWARSEETDEDEPALPGAVETIDQEPSVVRGEPGGAVSTSSSNPVRNAPIFERRPASAPPGAVRTGTISSSSSATPASSPVRATQRQQRASFQGDMDRCLNNLTAFSRMFGLFTVAEKAYAGPTCSAHLFCSPAKLIFSLGGGSRESHITDTLLYMISHDDMPFSTVERPGFQYFVKALQPLYQAPSEPTITKKIEAKYEQLKDHIGKRLANAEGLSLTLDLWTHKGTMNGYLGVTAHFREGTEIVCIELGARPMPERKTSANIAVALQAICADWKIDYNRVRAVVTDGGSNVKAAVRAEFGLDKHIECVAHKINCIGQSILGMPVSKPPSEEVLSDSIEVPMNEEEAIDFLDNPNEETDETQTLTMLRPLLIKVKIIVRFFRSSEVAKEELLKAQRERGKAESQLLRLIQEVRTRWNSAFYMLERFLQFQELVRGVLLKLKYERNSTKQKVPDFLSVEELDVLTEVKELLAPLEEATRIVSREKVVTISHVIPLVMALKQEVNRVMAGSPIAFNTKGKLLAEIDKRFSGVELLQPYAAATMLDPRYKQWAFESTQASSYVINHLSGKINEKVTAKAAEFDQQWREREEAEEADAAPSGGLWATLDSRIRQRSVGACDLQQAGGMPAQMKTYLSNRTLDRKSTPNPLEVWQTMRTGLEYVYELAMDFLPIVATSVASERLFSHAGLIATQLRNKISPKHLNMLVFMRSVPLSDWQSVH